MSDQVLDNVRVEINSVNHTANFKSCSLNVSRAQLDAWAMGDTVKGYRLGLFEITINGEAYNDYSSGGFDELMWDLLNNKTAATLKIRVDAGSAVGVNNPEYQLSAVYVQSRTPIDAPDVGVMAMDKLNIIPVKGCTITRATA